MREKIALIPAYEPDNLLIPLVETVNHAQFLPVVVDDGSGPEYEKIFKSLSKDNVLISYPENRGKGFALKSGLQYIQKRYGENCIVVTMDADGQHTAEDALRLCQTAQANPAALVLGSRALRKGTPLRSRFGNEVTRFVYRLSTGVKVHDTQTGLRAFDGSLLPKLLSISGDRYEYEMNVLLEFARQKIPMHEVQIETIYFDNNSGSHFDTVKDSCRVYKEIFKFSASSLAGFLIDYSLFSLLTLLTAGLSSSVSLYLSNIGARVVSAATNYTINRKLVFRSQADIAKSAFQYFLLAAGILIGNTALLHALVAGMDVNRFFAKIVTEIIFFFLSWFVQRCFIFRQGESVSTDKRGKEASDS